MDSQHRAHIFSTQASNWTFNFLLAFFTSFITADIGFSYGFVFAGCNLAGAIIVFFFLYESSNLSLENVDRMYNDPNCKPWNSKKWIPEVRSPLLPRRSLVS